MADRVLHQPQQIQKCPHGFIVGSCVQCSPGQHPAVARGTIKRHCRCGCVFSVRLGSRGEPAREGAAYFCPMCGECKGTKKIGP